MSTACVNSLTWRSILCEVDLRNAKLPDIFHMGGVGSRGDGGICVSAIHLLRVKEILGHKWDLVILTQLDKGSLRHRDLGRRIREIDGDLNDGVLSKTLRRLADDGLIYKQAVGKRHVHTLTDLGKEIVTILVQITDLRDEPPDPDEPSPDAPPHDPEQ